MGLIGFLAVLPMIIGDLLVFVIYKIFTSLSWLELVGVGAVFLILVWISNN